MPIAGVVIGDAMVEKREIDAVQSSGIGALPCEVEAKERWKEQLTAVPHSIST